MIPAQVVTDSQIVETGLGIFNNLQPLVSKKGTYQGNSMGFLKNGKMIPERREEKRRNAPIFVKALCIGLYSQPEEPVP
jgi:hypothetical protein